jgi:hypothetical protein
VQARSIRTIRGGLAAISAFCLLAASAAADNPPTTITSAPPLVSLSSTATFTFVNGARTAFNCTLDGGSTESCTSPKTYTGLANGPHMFAVKAVGASGPPVRYTWTVAVVLGEAPTVTITSGPSGETTSTTAAFSFTASQDGATFECELDGGSDQPCTSPVTYSNLDSGEHRFRVRATADGRTGDRAERAWTITPLADDTTPPVVTTPNGVTAEADGPGGARVTFIVTATDAGAPLPGSAISCSPASGSTFGLGSTTVQCTAKDAAGNQGKGSFTVTVRDTTAPAINAPDFSVTATSAGGIRRTDPAMEQYLGGVSATDLVSQPTVTNNSPDVLPVGKTEVTFTARDAAGNTARKQSTVTVLPVGTPAPALDLRPPGDVRRALARPGDHLVRLSWVAPTRDFHHVTITRSLTARGAKAKVVYRGAQRTFVDRRLSNGTLYRYVIVAFDRAGNRSKGVVVTARPRAILLARPTAGARVTAPPLLVWAPVRTASYFNVQLWRGKTKLLSVWPNAARYRLARTWSYEGQARRLAPGVYTWYVWPGLGPRSQARYGAMLGSSTFVVLPPQ